MPGRMSSKERRMRLAAEKEAEKKEKEEKAASKKKTTSRKSTSKKSKSTSSAGRMRLVWAVCDQAGNEVKTFDYPDKKKAEEEAARLTESKGKTHFVKKDRVPME